MKYTFFAFFLSILMAIPFWPMAAFGDEDGQAITEQQDDDVDCTVVDNTERNPSAAAATAVDDEVLESIIVPAVINK